MNKIIRDIVVMGKKAIVTPSTLLTGLVSYWKLDEASDGSDAVTRNDSVGTNHLTDFGTTPSQAGLKGNEVLFTTANSEYLKVDSNASLQMGDIDFTIVAWVTLTTVNAIHDILSKYNNTATNNREFILYYNYVGVDNAGNRFTFGVTSAGTSASIRNVLANNLGAPTAGARYMIKIWHDKTANTINIQVNNGTADSAAHTTGVFAGDSPFILGALPVASRYASEAVDEVGIWKRLLTTDEDTEIYNGGAGKTYPFDGGVPDGIVIFDGNSMTAEASSSYPSTAFDLLSGTWFYRNFGVSGQTTIEMIADGVDQIDSLYSAAFSNNVVVYWEVTNDLKLGATRADAQARMVTYCQARQAAGFKVVVGTILPREQVGTPETFEADRIAINTYIRENYTDFADVVADVAGDSRIGDAGDCNDTTYYNADKVHMVDAGYAIVAGIVATAIGTL